MEGLQGLGLYIGTFDPGDFVAYGAGVTFAHILDRIAFRKLLNTSPTTNLDTN